MSERLKTAGIITGVIISRAVLTAGDTTVRNHRDRAHHSITLDPLLAKICDVEQRAAGVNSGEWAADHRRHHHQFPDADLHGFWEISQCINYCTENGIDVVPDMFYGLDDLAPEFTRDEVMKLGSMAEEYREEVLGDECRAPTTYSQEEIKRILFDESPRYYYDKSFFDKKHIYADDEVVHILLRDQHSPLLAPPNPDGTRNGVRYVLLHNLQLSNVPTRMYRQRPWIMPEDLRETGLEPVPSNTPEVVGGFVFAGLVALAINRDFTIRGVAKSALEGAVVNAVGLGVLERGGAIVNAFGHLGVMTPENIRKASFSRDFEITPYPDGTIASDTEDGGIIGKIMGVITQDEAAKQRGHHKYPERIAFPDGEGNVSPLDSPWGSIIEKVTDSKYVPFIKRGPGFNVSDGGKREDMPGPAIEMLHGIRARWIKARLEQGS